MSADWIIKQGDSQPSFADTLSFSDGTVPPLQGATVQLELRSLTDASVLSTSGTVTVVNPNSGDVIYSPTVADTATPGNYFAEWVVTYSLSSGLGTQRFPTDGYNWVTIEPNLALAAQQIISLPVVKRYMNVQGNDHTRDVELMDIIDSITPLLESTVGPLIPKVYEEWFDGGSNVITLSYDPSEGFGSNPYIQLIAASEYRGPIEYPLALVASPTFGSIYSVMLVPHKAAITRRTAGGRTLAFMPGRESVHVWYKAGQSEIPKAIQRAAMEYVRTVYRWPQVTGTGTLSPADQMEMRTGLASDLSRIVNMFTRSMRRYPSIA